LAAVSQRSKSVGSMMSGMRLWILPATSFGAVVMIA
jgi:hypothetical protein